LSLLLGDGLLGALVLLLIGLPLGGRAGDFLCALAPCHRPGGGGGIALGPVEVVVPLDGRHVRILPSRGPGGGRTARRPSGGHPCSGTRRSPLRAPEGRGCGWPVPSRKRNIPGGGPARGIF